MDLEGGTVRRNYEGYSVKNKKTGKIVGVDIGVIFGDVALVFRSSGHLNSIRRGRGVATLTGEREILA